MTSPKNVSQEELIGTLIRCDAEVENLLKDSLLPIHSDDRDALINLQEQIKKALNSHKQIIKLLNLHEQIKKHID